jgi:hypothetical protein
MVTIWKQPLKCAGLSRICFAGWFKQLPAFFTIAIQTPYIHRTVDAWQPPVPGESPLQHRNP